MMWMFMRVALVVVLSSHFSCLAGTTIVVPDQYPTIQQAINAAAPGTRIVVREGVYPGSITFLGKAVEVVSERGPAVTVLDGGGSGPIVYFANREGRDTLLEGFTIRNGKNSVQGGGIYCRGASPTLRGNWILDNSAATAGGGLFCDFSDVLLEGNVFRANEAPIGGGAYFFEGRPRLEANLFLENHAPIGDGGGAIATQYVLSAVLVGNEFRDNTSIYDGGALRFADSEVTLEHNVIQRNESLSGDGGGLIVMGTSVADLSGNMMAENAALFGGGLCVRDGAILRTGGNRIQRNYCESLGGGIYAHASASLSMSGDFVTHNHGAGGGGGVAVLDCDVTMDNLRFFRNEASNGLAIYFGEVSGEVRNTTIVGHRGQNAVAVLGPQRRTLRYSSTIIWNEECSSDLAPGYALADYCDIRGGHIGTGNIDEDPRIVGIDRGDLHLRWDSPCVDAGDPGSDRPLDFEGQRGKVDGDGDGILRVDMGADEMLPEIAARFGSVGSRFGRVVDTLAINGSSGDHERALSLGRDGRIEITMSPAPDGPDPGRFVLYAWDREPDDGTVTLAPFGLGLMTFATALNRGRRQLPVVVWNNIGWPGRLGAATRASQPAPSVVARSGLIGAPAEFTLQGIIEDNGSSADGPFSATNAVVVNIGE